MAFGSIEKLLILIEAAYNAQGVDQAKRGFKELDAATENSSRNVDKFNKAIKAAGISLGAAGLALAAKKAYQALGEGAALNTAANQFDILTAKINTTSDALLVRMREASNGFSTDAELIASANQIISLGLAKTENDVADLASVIGGLGLDMQQVILTFANNSKARLDSLGLSIEDVNAKTKELEQAGFQGDAFDAAVLELLTGRYQEMAGAIDDTEKAIRRAETAYANFIDNAKRGFASSVGESILGFEQRTGDLKALNQAFKDGQIDIKTYAEAIGPLLYLLDDTNLRDTVDQIAEMNRELGGSGSFSATAVAAWGEFLGLFGDQRNVFNLENTAERLEYLGRVADDSADGNYTYEVSAEQVAAAEEKRAAAHERVANILQGGLAAATERAKQNALDLAAAAEESAQRMADAFSEAIGGGGTDFFTDPSGYFTGGRSGDQSELLADFRGELEKAQRTIRDYESGLKGFGETQEAINKKLEKAREAVGYYGAKVAELEGIQGEWVQTSKGGEVNIEAVNKALYEQIEAAGADAETLAFAGVALGQFTEAQAKAALEQAALNEKLVELGKEVANGNLTIDQALEKFDSYRQGLQDTEAQAQRNKEATIEYTQAINDIPEEKRTELFVEKEAAVSAVEDLRQRLDRIPRTIDIDINIHVPQSPEVYRPGGDQNYEDEGNIPKRATGGPVSAFQPYIVGERGPEMFVPSQNGTIVPNGAMGNTFNISVNVSAGGGGADRSLIPIVRDGVLEALQRVGAY